MLSEYLLKVRGAEDIVARNDPPPPHLGNERREFAVHMIFLMAIINPYEV